MSDHAFPHAVEAEKALLGALMVDASQLADIGEVLSPGDFYSPQHGKLFELLLTMQANGDVIDTVTVSTAVGQDQHADTYGGLGYVASLPAYAPSATAAPSYALLVETRSRARRAMASGLQLQRGASGNPEQIDDAIRAAIDELSNFAHGVGRTQWQQLSLVLDESAERVDAAAAQGERRSGHTTGFIELDKKLSGFHKTDLVILAARPGMGKTALALNLALNVAIHEGLAVGVFSLEMSADQLGDRLICAYGRIDAGRLRDGLLDADERQLFNDTTDYLRKTPLFIDDSGNLSITELGARARRLKSEQPDLGLIVVDYLQLMRGDDARAPREQQIAAISRGLKALAKDLDCPILALSQLNRGVESRKDKRPMLSDLRESGAIEQDADVILFIYRDEYYDEGSEDSGVAEVLIAKQRRGSTGSVRLVFQGRYLRFDNMSSDATGDSFML